MDFANTVWDWKVRHKSLGKTGELVVITGKLSTYKNKEQSSEKRRNWINSLGN